jgi:hypothetical protein
MRGARIVRDLGQRLRLRIIVLSQSSSPAGYDRLRSGFEEDRAGGVSGLGRKEKAGAEPMPEVLMARARHQSANRAAKALTDRLFGKRCCVPIQRPAKGPRGYGPGAQIAVPPSRQPEIIGPVAFE